MAAGEIVAVTGPSGSGKTTLLRLIGGEESLDRGVIEVAGRTMADDRVDLGPLRRPIASVAQGAPLLEDRNVGENIASGLPRKERNRRTGALRVAEMFDLLDLATPLADRRPPELSVSERQRVAVARALIGRPALVLLDEPFYAFDPQTRDRIRGELGRVLRATSTATVLVSHHANDPAELADRQLRLRDGRLSPPAD